ELAAALMEADEYNAVHCVVLRGAGPHFCAGADLSEYSSGRGEAYRGRQEIDDDVWRLEQGQRLRMTLFDIHKPVIAQVHGTCIGIGTDLAWLCDMVLVAEDAHRLPARTRPGHASGQHVAVPLRPTMGEAAAADRRQRHRRR